MISTILYLLQIDAVLYEIMNISVISRLPAFALFNESLRMIGINVRGDYYVQY